MKHFFYLSIVLFLATALPAQNFSKDSVLLKVNSKHKSKAKIIFKLENHTGAEIIRLDPMAPLQIFKWDGKAWVQVPQLGYCSCGIVQCPPPPDQVPFYANDVLEFEWDQMQSRCLDPQKGTKEVTWAGKGKYKAVFEMKKERYGESFFVEKEFSIRRFYCAGDSKVL